MTAASVFPCVNLLALVTWVALIARPRHPLVLRCAGRIVPLILAGVYVAILGVRVARGGVEGDFNTLAGVAALFRDPWILLAGWVHYLAFDLWIGAWEARDAEARDLPRWRLVPCLVLTFLVGPAGWLLYQVLRAKPGCPGEFPASEDAGEAQAR